MNMHDRMPSAYGAFGQFSRTSKSSTSVQVVQWREQEQWTVIKMLWSEVRELYPNTWVMVSNERSHIEDGKQYVDEVSVIRTLSSSREAKKMLMECSGDTFVYHTLNPEIVIEILPNPLLRINHAN